MSLKQIVYASRSRLVEANRGNETARIIATARRLNGINGVTGFLLATPAAFAQILEGETTQVAEVFARIKRDSRHDEIQLLGDSRIASRRFASWAMGLAEKDETTNFIFGLYGVAPDSDLDRQPLETLLDLAGELSSRPE